MSMFHGGQNAGQWSGVIADTVLQNRVAQRLIFSSITIGTDIDPACLCGGDGDRILDQSLSLGLDQSLVAALHATRAAAREDNGMDVWNGMSVQGVAVRVLISR